jgi:ubiquitin carboxyl-terminal hydrolase 8
MDPYQDEPKGILNLGNTCFINSCIQILYYTHELSDLMDTSKRRNITIKEYSLFEQWIDVRDLMSKSPPYSQIVPKSFLQHISQYAKTTGHEMEGPQDASEFLILLLEAFHHILKRPVRCIIHPNHSFPIKDNQIIDSCNKWIEQVYEKEYSEIIELFYGVYYSKITSINDSTILSIKPEMFFVLDLPVQTYSYTNPNESTIYYHQTIDECLKSLLLEERLEGDNAWYNDKTKQKEPINKKMCFWKFPPILILLFKRFSFDGTKTKDTRITFPIESFDLSQYLSNEGFTKTNHLYDLYGICNHYGDTDGGHYTAMVQNKKKEWYHYNDHSIEKIIEPSHLVTQHAYCLFYRKRK